MEKTTQLLLSEPIIINSSKQVMHCDFFRHIFQMHNCVIVFTFFKFCSVHILWPPRRIPITYDLEQK